MMKKICIVLFVLSVLALSVPACGSGSDEETSTVIPSYTATPVNLGIATTPAPGYGMQVKIGAMMAWSGPLGASGYLADQVLNLVDKKVKDMGGLLGGRELKIVKYDTRGAVADAAAGATKLVKEDNVCALAWGGPSSGELTAVARKAEELQVLYVPEASPDAGVLETTKYTILPAPQAAANWVDKIEFITGKLKPNTIAFLYNDDIAVNRQIELVTAQTEPAGIKTVYTGLVSADAVDMSPYLTKIKYANPEVLVLGLYTPQAMTAAKQITELGGWGNIQVLGIPSCLEASKLSGSWGWIVETAWVPTSDYSPSVKFVEDFKVANGGKTPNINSIWFYTPIWSIIETIQQTGTDDRATIAQYARSGSLQWDTPMGIINIAPDGNSDLHYIYVRILEGGKSVLFE